MRSAIFVTGGICVFGTCPENVRARSPLVHNITNYVTVNDVENILLASGGICGAARHLKHETGGRGF